MVIKGLAQNKGDNTIVFKLAVMNLDVVTQSRCSESPFFWIREHIIKLNHITFGIIKISNKPTIAGKRSGGGITRRSNARLIAYP